MDKQLIALVSRQRSGTNALRAVIGSHPDIFCFEEVLNPEQHYLEHEWSYFRFIQENHTLKDLHPENHLNVFNNFLHHLHGLHDKPMTLIDLKYNTCAHVGANFISLTRLPLFAWLKLYQIPVIHLKRSNYLRVALSQEMANQRGVWHDRTGEERVNVTNVHMEMFEERYWLRQMELWKLEDKVVSSTFDDYTKLFPLEYEDMYPQMNQPINPATVEGIAELLGVDNQFETETWCTKSTRRPMWEAISNWNEVVEILSGTEFEWQLQDEPMYRGITEVVADKKKVKLMTASALLRRLTA